MEEQVKANQMDYETAKARRSMMKALMASPGWKFMEEQMQASLRAWEAQLMKTAPVGEGAATIARAQGAITALKQVSGFPSNTVLACEAVMKGS